MLNGVIRNRAVGHSAVTIKGQRGLLAKKIGVRIHAASSRQRLIGFTRAFVSHSIIRVETIGMPESPSKL